MASGERAGMVECSWTGRNSAESQQWRTLGTGGGQGAARPADLVTELVADSVTIVIVRVQRCAGRTSIGAWPGLRRNLRRVEARAMSNPEPRWVPGARPG